MKHHFYLIINSNAGSGNGHRLGTALTALLDSKDLDYTAYFTKKAGDEGRFALELAQEALIPFEEGKTYDRFPLLVVLGGDGTLSHVVDALKDYPLVPIAYIPAGSGNDFARANGIYTRDLDEALSNILMATKPKRLHILEALDKNYPMDRVLVNSFGIGIDGAVIQKMSQSTLKERMNKLGLGFLSYPLSLMSVLFHQAPFTATLKTGETVQTFENIYLLTTTNHPYFGGGINIAPTSHIQQAGIDIILIQKKSWWRVLQIVGKLLQGKHLDHPDVHHFHGTDIHISVEKPQHAQIDGELVDFQPFELNFKQASRYFWMGD